MKKRKNGKELKELEKNKKVINRNKNKFGFVF